MGTIRITLSIAVLCLWSSAFAQSDVPLLPWEERDRKDMKPVDYEYQRQADVMWSKFVWRTIDVRQKMNKPFAWPQQPLIQVIHEAAKKGDVRVYDPAVVDADQFKQVMALADIEKIGKRVDTMILQRPDNPEIEETVISVTQLSWDKITKYRIKEVWFFDTRTSTMKVRILGLAPVMEYYNSEGEYVGDMTMYWIYFPDLRDMLAKHEVFNTGNDSQRYSWDDLFEMRKFASYIYKESNVYDRNVQEYASGTDAQLESDRIKQELFIKEHDLWNY